MTNMETANLKLECLRLAGGELGRAEQNFAFVSGSKPHDNAIAALERAADVCEANTPIYVADGNSEEAAATKANGDGYRAAVEYLQAQQS